jgi:hypothetical protein
MKPAEYIEEALSTEHTPDFVRLYRRTETGGQAQPYPPEHNMLVARLLHALMGEMSEIGELADNLKKHIIYDRELSRLNQLEERGDLQWYEALALSALKLSYEQVFAGNIAKLRKRFPDRFRLSAATERDTEAEMDALEATLGVAKRDTTDEVVRDLQSVAFNYWRAAILTYDGHCHGEVDQHQHNDFDTLWQRYGAMLPINWRIGQGQDFASTFEKIKAKAKATAERHLAEPDRAPATGVEQKHAYPEEYANKPINATITDTHPAIRNTDEPQTTYTKADMDELREKLYTEMEQRRVAVNKVVELENRINALVTTFDALRKP